MSAAFWHCWCCLRSSLGYAWAWPGLTDGKGHALHRGKKETPWFLTFVSWIFFLLADARWNKCLLSCVQTFVSTRAGGCGRQAALLCSIIRALGLGHVVCFFSVAKLT